MGFNVFTLFVGFGLGSLIFGAMLSAGFTAALGAFGGVALLAALAALPVFAKERVLAPTSSRKGRPRGDTAGIGPSLPKLGRAGRYSIQFLIEPPDDDQAAGR